MARSSKKKTGDSSRGNRRWLTALFFTVVVVAISAYFLMTYDFILRLLDQHVVLVSSIVKTNS